MNVKPTDIKTIRASARRVIEIANNMGGPNRDSLILEAITVLKLTGGQSNGRD